MFNQHTLLSLWVFGSFCLLARTPTVAYAQGQASSSSATRIRLFRIQPGFLSEPPGLETAPVDESEVDEGPEWLSLAMGNDNPFFELRQRGDPGGVGFARLNTQVQLFDTSRTACSLGLQAVMPAGIEYDGLPDRMGPTVLTPILSLYHALGDQLAVQAFVGKNMPLMKRTATGQPISRDVQYGVALQHPLTLGEVVASGPLQHLYLSVGAIGQYRLEREGTLANSLDVLPGLHWKPADNWWISGAVVLPVTNRSLTTPVTSASPQQALTTPPSLLQQWQVTCWLQF